MLTVSRKRDESVMVVTDQGLVEVVVLSGGTVKLGFRAPREIPIHRKEVYEAIQRSKPVEEV